MSISIICPHCGCKIKAPDSAVGKTARCPKCKNAVSITIEDIPLEIETPNTKKTKRKNDGCCGCVITLSVIGFFVWMGATCSPKTSTKKKSDNSNSEQSKPSSQAQPEFTADQLKEQMNTFASTLSKHGIDSSLVTSVNINSFDQNTLEIHVTNIFVLQQYQIRLQAAQNLWKLWSVIHMPNSPDTSRISILDINGNEIGGSRVWGGSLIWVSDK